MSHLHTPVLFLIFNRPNFTQTTFNEIKKVKPKQLFIAADGPRKNNPSDTILCPKARKIIEQIDWPCDVKTLFQNENLGCGPASNTAINWFFKHVEAGIILEDDCVPNESFFFFCQEMLQKYKNDSRVFHITGTNYNMPLPSNGYSYYFSRIPSYWGWASWRRARKFYDFDMKNYPTFKKENIIKNIYTEEGYQESFLATVDWIYLNHEKVADYQWLYTMLTQNGLCITPYKNLTTNIGAGMDATHPAPKENNKMCYHPTEIMDTKKIVHPIFMVPSRKNDAWIMREIFGTKTRFPITAKIKRLLLRKKHRFAQKHTKLKKLYRKIRNFIIK